MKKVTFTMFLMKPGQHRYTQYKLTTIVHDLPKVGDTVHGDTAFCPARGHTFHVRYIEGTKKNPLIVLALKNGRNCIINAKRDKAMIDYMDAVGWKKA